MTGAPQTEHTAISAAHVGGEPDNAPREECGVFGVWAPGEEVAKLTYYGLYALQHRGQEAAGIAVADGSQVLVFKDLGLVSQVFEEQTLAAMEGHVAIGHCRYSTTGSTTWENAQPVFRNTAAGTGIALGHNGNLVNTTELAARARDARADQHPRRAAPPPRTPTSSAHCWPTAPRTRRWNRPRMELLPAVRGAFCLTFMDENTLYAARDPYGVRPLSLGRLDRGWVVASETAALDIVGASFVRDIEPGELLAIDADGVRSIALRQPHTQGLRVRVRLPGPAGQHDRRPLGARHPRRDRPPLGAGTAHRRRPGDRRPRVRHPGRGRLRAGVGHPVRPGPDEERLRRPHLHPAVADDPPARHPAQAQPAASEVIRGKRLIVVDDSIVRGNTQRALVRMLREAGAVEVHVRIASPPVKWPCFYGIDFATPAELIANAVDDRGRNARGGAPRDRRRHPRLHLAGRA